MPIPVSVPARLRASHQVRGRVRCRELRRFPGHVSGFVPVWALAAWAALRFVPASRTFAFSRSCFVVSFFELSVWFVVSRLEDFRNSSAGAFGPNDVTGDEKRRETDGHKTPESEHLPIQTGKCPLAWSVMGCSRLARWNGQVRCAGWDDRLARRTGTDTSQKREDT